MALKLALFNIFVATTSHSNSNQSQCSQSN